ncbi:hypothetical protein OB920_17345 [Halobacteria archaeon HArc-gm2]|nr:hypothetical protein [Halobacteria archaeon HArc-gm2]
MILRVGGQTFCGAVVDLRDVDVDASSDGASIAAAIRGEESRCGVHCPPASPVHARAGYVRPGMGLSTRTALAAAGRSRGLDTPSDDELAAVRSELAALDGDETECPSAPTTAPDADRERLRERVAELRGRVQALESTDRDASNARSKLRDAARRLSELETERVAAVETRERSRALRDRRERRLKLQDRGANLERDARAHLVADLREEFAAAVDSLQAVSAGGATANDRDHPFDVDPVTAALAILRIAAVRAPVVLTVDRFEHPAAAARWLAAPVVRL